MVDVPRLRVKALRPSRRRAGFAFSPEIVELTRDDFEAGETAAATQFLALVSDPKLLVVMVDEDGGEKALTAEQIELLREHVARLWAETELQPASGVAGETGGGAPAPVDLTTSSEEANASATSAHSPGTGTSSAGDPGQPREKADASEGSAATGAGEGKEPGETSRPPVADAHAEPNNGPSAAPAAGKPAGKAKPKGATQARAE